MLPDILLVILDTARADAFRPWGGPHPSPVLERLSAEGSWYERAVAPAPWTLPSCASILSGLPASEHGVDARSFTFRDGRPTSPAGAVRSFTGAWLPDHLRERGYATLAVSCNPWLSSWGGFGRGFDRFVDVRPWPRVVGGRVGRGVRRLRQVAGRRGHGGPEALDAFGTHVGEGGGAPRFALVNLMEMHAPYDPPWAVHPTRRRGRADPDIRTPALLHRQLRQAGLRQRPDATYVAAIRELYMAAGRHADRLTGSLVEAFLGSSRGPVVVVVVSDHGENLGDHGLFAHHSSLHESLLHVPLVVWARGIDVAGGPITRPCSLLGLAGWMLGVADGKDGPPALEGPITSEYESTLRHIGMNRELRARVAREGEQALPRLVRHAGLAVRDGDRKYVALDDGTEALHDLRADPLEERDLLVGAPDLAQPFRPARDAWLGRLERGMSSAPGSGPADEQPVQDVAEDEIAEHLRALGYIE